MGLRVTAAQAAWLVDRHERMVRWHIARGDLAAVKEGRAWRIDVDTLAGIPGWRVNRERLAELETADERTAASLVARLAELERQMRDLRARLARLEAREASSGGLAAQATRSEGQQAASEHGGSMLTPPDASTLSGSHYSALQDMQSGMRGLSPDARHILSDYPTARTVTLADRGPGAPLRFKTKSDAARWLARHGINEHTPKTWRGWPPDELTPAAALAFALEVQTAARARGDWRVSWSLRQCSDAACVCQDMLAE